MAADYSRIHRLLKILTLIQGQAGWTPARLAVECRTTQRTIYRDMRMLQGAGIPYFYDKQKKCYSVGRDFFLPPVQLTFDESLALTALAEHAGRAEQVPFMGAAARAISKIRGQLPLPIRQDLEQIESRLEIRLAAAMPPEGAGDVYNAVRHAMAAGRVLRCEYEAAHVPAPGPDHPEFLFKPYTLWFNQRAWYVLGHHEGHNAIRCLKLSRFTHIEPTAIPYQIPRGFSLVRHLGNAWRMIRGHTRYDVKLHFDAEFAETIADTQWHSTQETRWHDDGSITVRYKVDGLDEILWWILGMGPHCFVIHPPELARRVKELTMQTAARYATQGAARAFRSKSPPSRRPSRKQPAG